MRIRNTGCTASSSNLEAFNQISIDIELYSSLESQPDQVKIQSCTAVWELNQIKCSYSAVQQSGSFSPVQV